ncbi:MAG: hypothetical protein VX294_00760 [Candidatus Latescibacterota bacterium]|nr:hypothetical protein [Candidatus Latescibacterota bacterium]
MSEIDNILSQRLFGYGIPYEVEIDSSGKFSPVKGKANVQALELSKTLESWSREGKNYSVSEAESSWAYSMPFGRCGLAGLPLEHLQVSDAEEIHIDVLSEAGLERKLISENDIILIKPLTVIRLRLRSKPGRRAIVAFQTEDQTPLAGNAGPYSLQGVTLPTEPLDRFVASQEAFEQTSSMGSKDRNQELAVFFSEMALNLKDISELELLQDSARSAGSYDVGDQNTFFMRQKVLLTEGVLDRISKGDPEMFRYPGMFGAVAPLFSLLK